MTNQAFVDFLNDLLDQGREVEALALVPKHRGSTLREDGPLVYKRGADGRFHLPSAEEEILPEWPALMISYRGARAYARWAAQRSGLPWRLPWEVEWEKAARGADGRAYPWGNECEGTYCCCAVSQVGVPSPAAVTDFPCDESPFGVRGMAGNMRDWCLDRFSPALDDKSLGSGVYGPGKPPEIEDDGLYVMRGGDWYAKESFVTVVGRSPNFGNFRDTVTGLRLARSVSPPKKALSPVGSGA